MKYFSLLLIFYIQPAFAEYQFNLIECRVVSEISSVTGSHISMPTDVAVDTRGQLYVVDSGNHRVLVFNSNGDYLFVIGSEGSGDKQLLYPVGIATSTDGRILIADRGNKRIQVYSHEGKHLRAITIKSNGILVTPVDIAVNRNENRIYVTASAPIHQLFVLDNNGKVISTVGKAGNNEGEFRYPATVAVGDEDEIYVVDVLNTRVQVFDNLGNFLVTVGSWGVTQGQLFRPKGIALSANKLIFVSDSYLGVVQVYNSDTRFRSVLAIGGDVARFTTPVGMTIDGDNRLYIAEAMANRVTVCQL